MGAKVIGKVLVASIGKAEIVSPDGSVRDAVYGSLVYEGEQIVSNDPTTLFEIKYLGLPEPSVYEGVFGVLADGSVVEDVSELDALFGDSIDFMDTAGGQSAVVANSGLAEDPGIVASSHVQDFYRSNTNEAEQNTQYAQEKRYELPVEKESVSASDQNAPVIESESVVVFDENSNDDVLKVSASDNANVTYSLADGLDSNLFTIDANTGVLRFKQSPDYEHPQDSNGDNEYKVEVVVKDTTGNYTTQEISVNINNVNEGIIVSADVDLGSVAEDNSYTFTQADLLANATDIDGDTLSVNSLTATNGTITDLGNGSYKFTPNADFNGDVEISYKVNDGTLDVDAKAKLNVTPVNDAPVATDDAVVTITSDVFIHNSSFEEQILSDGSYERTVSGWVYSDDGRTGVINPTTSSYTNGAADGENVAWIDTHHGIEQTLDETLDTHSVYTLKVDVGERKDGNSVGEYTVAVYAGNTLIASVDEHDFPVVKDQFIEVKIDIDGSQYPNLEGEKLRIRLSDDATGNHQVSFDNVTMTKTTTDIVHLNEDTSVTIPSEALIANDTDADGDQLTITQVQATADTHGVVSLDANGNIVYTPDADYNGEAKFDYTISDGHGGSDTATVTLKVDPVNDAPVIDSVHTMVPPADEIVFWIKDPASDQSDKAGNGHDITNVGNNIYTMSNSDDINTQEYNHKTFSVKFTTADVDPNDPIGVIYEEGGSVNGYNIAMVGTHAYAFAWRESGDDYHKVIDLGELESNKTYTVTMVHDAQDSSHGTLSAYLDGVKIDTLTGVGTMASHPGSVGIGGFHNDSVDPTNPTQNTLNGTGGEFKGSVDEVISWNKSLDSDKLDDLFKYMNQDNDYDMVNNLDLSGSVNIFDVDASDVDGDTLTYSLKDDFGGKFSIDNDGIISSNNDGIEFDNIYTLDVIVKDGSNEQATTQLKVKVEGDNVVKLDMNNDLVDTSTKGNVVDEAALQNGALLAGGVLKLDGVDDSIKFNSSSDINTGTHEQRSISLWFNTQDDSGTQYLYAEGGGARSLQIYMQDGVLMAKGYNHPDGENDWTNDTILNSGVDVSDGKWHHVVLSVAGDANDPEHSLSSDGFKIYVDGDLKDSGVGGAIYSHLPAWVGADYSGEHTFSGEVENLRIFNQELTSNDVVKLTSEGYLGDSGDNIIDYNSDVFVYDGGDGNDTLVVGENNSLDLSNVSDLNNIEVIQLDKGASVTDSLDGINIEDILDITGGSNKLVIESTNHDSGDVNIDLNEFSKTSTTAGHDVYTAVDNGTTYTIEIDDTIHVV